MPDTASMPVSVPEFDLVLECLRRSLHATPPSPSQPVPENIDWPALQALAKRHAVIPLVFPYLAPLAPPHAIEPLATAFHSSWAYAQTLATELEYVLAAFDQAGIESMPFKGPVLAEMLFGDVAARASLDIDVLVQPRDNAAAQAALAASGFIADLLPRPASRPAHDPAFYRDNVRLELHSTFGRPELCPIDSKEVWSRSLPAVFRGHAIRVMTQEDCILYLSYHLLVHNCERLQWIADLARALAILAETDSGDRLIHSAKDRDLDELLLFAAALAAETLRTPLPAAISAALRKQPKVIVKAQTFLEEGLRNQGGTMSPRERSAHAAWSFYSPERSPWRRWIRRFRELAPCPRDRAWAEYKNIPAPLITPLLPLLRLVRILRAYGFAGAWRNFMQGTR
jgi:hypothetical protein